MTLTAEAGSVTLRRSEAERVSLIVIRCSAEDCAPETLRIRTTYYPELSTGIGEVRVFATADAAVAAVDEALGACAARASGPGMDRPPGSA